MSTEHERTACASSAARATVALGCVLVSLLALSCSAELRAATWNNDGLAATSSGVLSGVRSGATWAFLGVPYASPPVAALRFRSPEPAPTWEGTREASAFAPDCRQPLTPQHSVQSEDCLYLNVWVPDAPPSAPRPVLLAIHGGAHIRGSGAHPIMKGERLSAATNTVVVTINYRLGVLGFLAHPDLAIDDPGGHASNFGILDQIAALRWVRDNIAAFGGDPARVILFGVSSGASSIAIAMASPLAAGLFSGAILQSGSMEVPSESARFAANDPIVQRVGCDDAADIAACLRSVDADALLAATPVGRRSQFDERAVGPAVDGKLLQDSPHVVIAQGSHSSMPVMLGTTTDEAAFWYATPMSESEYRATVHAQLDHHLGTAKVNDLLSLYPVARYGDPRRALVALMTDGKFHCPTRQMARRLAQGQTQPVYRYVFAAFPDTVPPSDIGAPHAIDLYYVMQRYESMGSLEDTILSWKLGWAWALLGHLGFPVVLGSPAWLPYELGSESVLRIDVTSANVPSPRAGYCDVWDALGVYD